MIGPVLSLILALVFWTVTVRGGGEVRHGSCNCPTADVATATSTAPNGKPIKTLPLPLRLSTSTAMGTSIMLA